MEGLERPTCSLSQGQPASEVKKGHPEGAGWQGRQAPLPPESTPWASGPPVEAGALSVRTGSLYQPGPTGPQLTAPLGACPQQASLCSPTAQEAEERAEAQAQPRPARGSLQAVPALRRGARQSGTAWLPTDASKQRPGPLSWGLGGSVGCAEPGPSASSPERRQPLSRPPE